MHAIWFGPSFIINVILIIPDNYKKRACIVRILPFVRLHSREFLTC